MSISAKLSDSSNELVIQVAGRFDFSAHQDFRSAYEDLENTPQSYAVDMAQTTYLDSSALGMLLLLRDHAGGDDASIRLINCNDDVRKILVISNFGRLFTIQ
ncbi:MAG: STAS domain-containing protein [Gammaproteobacteria bacterium]|nr:STAS domain-containing protein [Gammaproteobacteria bacterium]MBT8150969.1 STAS domain-containing protein [Gammaproteobacteria bacterium]NND39841.1 STAS domain-containing protein [Pseudomonadales bacterium]NNM11153.1 STAS domain-containing protein [Pseudomonadales bacterium]RZV51224.1 MAG: anti-sigma factor antagonist [Pseudomonadales bacterium]